MIYLAPQTIALLVVVPLLAYFIGKWLFQKDTELENRRKAAGKLAGILQTYGLKKTPEFLIDYSVGDYSGMANKIQKLAELAMEDPAHVVAELDGVYKSVLDVKLKTEEGRALIAAKLADATPLATAA